MGCDKFIDEETELPKIINNNEKVISENCIKWHQFYKVQWKRYRQKLKAQLPLAGKTGTTNDNYDAWFIGFSSNLVIGVYVGYDTPKTLGKFETGAKAALPIFKDFIEKSLYKEDFEEFQIPENIYLTSINYDTGIKSALGEKNSIIEALKYQDINNLDNNNIVSFNDNDRTIKFRQFY